MKKAKLTTNVLTKNYSGIFGNRMVLMNRNGKSIMTIPMKRKATPPTQKQMDVRRMFTLASRYATNVLQNPDMLAAYTAKSREGLSPYIVAMTDYLRPPYVSDIDAGDYTGTPGDRIHVTADDDFGVAGVHVAIISASGDEIEKGECVQDPLTGRYDYVTTGTVADLAGVEIVAVARDFPGHTGEHSVTL